MKDLFAGHYTPSAEAFQIMWKHGTFAFDANVLLGIYRLSEATVGQLLGILERLRDRIWLPYQAAAEYHANLSEVIAAQQRPYANAIESLQSLHRMFDNPREHPFIPADLLKQWGDLRSQLELALQNGQNNVLDLLTENPHKEALAGLFAGRVGPDYTAEQRLALFEEGARRYAERVPPGYKDVDKPEPSRYGDLLIWKQLLDFAAGTDRPVIFVTGDVKEDWFLRAAGRTISPRPELIAEFRSVSQVDFHIYTTTSFLQSANSFLAAGVPDLAIQEVLQNEARVVTKSPAGEPGKPTAEHISGVLGVDIAMLREWGTLPRRPYYVATLKGGAVAIMHRRHASAFVIFRPKPEGGYTVEDMGPSEWSRRIIDNFDPTDNGGFIIEMAVDSMRERRHLPTTPAPQVLEVPDLMPGKLVRHPTFGTGLVTKIAGYGDATIATIDFENLGSKRVVAKYAALQMLTDDERDAAE